MGWLPEGLHRRRRRTISFKPNSGLRPPGGRRYSVLVEVFQQSDQKGNINAGLRLQYFVRTGEARLGFRSATCLFVKLGLGVDRRRLSEA